jgi:H(+)-translocating pyrophosphatase
LLPLIVGIVTGIVAAVFASQIWNANNEKLAKMPVATKVSTDISNGAVAFLNAEYKILTGFVSLIFLLIMFCLDFRDDNGDFKAAVPGTAICFVIGAILSAACGYAGMIIATRANVRTALAVWSAGEEEGLNAGLKVAFKSGSVMAFSVVAAGLFGLSVCFLMFFDDSDSERSFNQLAGFAFGASSIALFARVGGGIYTKAADVGADLVGKVEENLGEDDANNPATVADNVGDNVGDVAGMGADLFESFVGSIVAAATLGYPSFGYAGIALPFWLAGMGALVSIFGTFLVRAKGKEDMQKLLAAVDLSAFVEPAYTKEQCEKLRKAKISEAKLEELLWVIRKAIYATTILVLLLSLLIIELTFGLTDTGMRLWGVIIIGSVTGNLIGYFTEYSTSYTEWPTKSIADKAATGGATVIIQGLGIGMLSTIPPVIFLVIAILASYYLMADTSGIFGIAVSAVGMLSTLGITLATDAYGPVADNAGGIFEMSKADFVTADGTEEEWVRDETDSLDSLGNTTAATGKGFAIGSAVLTALALLNAFAQATDVSDVNLLDPAVLPGILIGALLPFVFASLTMLSVGKAAEAIMYECRLQFNEMHANPDLKVDPAKCIAISTQASLVEMVAPGTLAVFSPMIIGCILGVQGLMGLLAGAISAGFLLAVTMSNAGGAWDNSKKFVEAKGLKNTKDHEAVVIGDTVGDPFKDTSGPALNILIKLMSVVSLVMAPLFKETPWDETGIIVGVILIVIVGIFLTVFSMKFSEGVFTQEERNTINAKAKVRREAEDQQVVTKEKEKEPVAEKPTPDAQPANAAVELEMTEKATQGPTQ